MQYLRLGIALVGLGLWVGAMGPAQAQEMTRPLDSIQQMVDSVRVADSLAEIALLEALFTMQEADARRQARLQAELDSMASAQAARQQHLQTRVDSLRLSTPGAAVVVYGDTLFWMYARLGPFSAQERVNNLLFRLKQIEALPYDSTQFQIRAEEDTHDLMYADITLTSVTDRDALWADMPRHALAAQHLRAIMEAEAYHRTQFQLWRTLKRIALLLLVSLLLVVGYRYVNRVFAYLTNRIVALCKPWLKGLSFRNYEFLSAEREEQLLVWLLRVVKWLVVIIVLYLVFPIIFSIFPSTRGLADTLFGYVTRPLRHFAANLIGYIPEFITIVIILVINHYFVRFLKFLAEEVRTEKLQLPGFFPDWALPTYNILRIVAYAFSFVLIFPYLPGSDSPIFRGVSVFFGVLISLGSSSAISNIIAGLVITYMRAFRLGDRVKIGDVTGDVIEKSMLVTRLRTIKNEDVTIPNVAILNGSTVNYTSSAQSLGLILNTTVTIGYDVPWRQVHQLLIDAARQVPGIRQDPPPFVFQTSLDDFYVSYQLNAYTDQAGKAAKLYSELHAYIQDGFAAAGLEIMSPHYRAERDGSAPTIPTVPTPRDEA